MISINNIKRSSFILFVLLLATFIAGPTQQVSATDFPGPDAFGYVGTTVPFNLRDVSATGTNVPLSDDEVSGAIQIPFLFNFYGIVYTQLFISSNGFIKFTGGGSSGCCSGEPIPTAGGDADNLIAGWWNDLYPPGSGEVRYQTLGAEGSREFVVGFYNMQYCCGGSTNVTFEMILHEETQDIELQYASAPGRPGGSNTSVGIENNNGRVGLQVAFGEFDFNDQGFLLSPEGRVRPIPTLSEWGLLAMAGVLGIVGLLAVRRRKATA